MRKALLATVALALLAPASAAAKELVKVQVCGSAACAATADKTVIGKIAGNEGGAVARTPALAPYYKLEYTIDIPAEEGGGGQETFSAYYVPGVGVQSAPDEHGNASWFELGPDAQATLMQLAKGLQPLPKPQITGVTVGSMRVSSPATYERLLTLRGHRTLRAVRDWRRVRFQTDRPSPWSDGVTALRFSPKRGFIYRDGRAHVLPRAMAARIKAGQGLGALSPVELGAAFGLGLGLLLLRRRRRS
ncbi:MAG: hypothetical protein M3R70_07320 [Actinomycetota bacterium]|nr:hypothetical protein [Actinomycetota bacterium]